MSSTKSQWLERCGFPRLGRNTSMDKISDDLEFKSLVKAYLENITERLKQGRGLYLWGEHGSGKSSIAYLIGKKAKSKHKFCRLAWVQSWDIAGYLIKDPPFSSEESWKHRILNCDLLVIDDLIFNEKDRDNYIENVIRKRCHERKSMIITGNIAPKEIPSPAIKSLLKECCFPICVSGIDWREDNRLKNP